MNQQRVTLLVLLDLSAAFDTVDHTILFERLHRDSSISGQVYSWFESYISATDSNPSLSTVEHQLLFR